MRIPFEPVLFGFELPVHLILEYLAFFIAFRYYLWLRRQQPDTISSANRLSILVGATAGAFIGSRLIGYLENPINPFRNAESLQQLLQAKTIMGGLFGGLLGVELAKKIIKEPRSSGDLFTLPIITGIFIGRIGCLLNGTKEFTYGSVTRGFTGMDLGDGLLRHPIALYELMFLLLLFISLKALQNRLSPYPGMLFKLFMLSYFSFRFGIEFIKPNLFIPWGLSTIQWLCVLCLLYYSPTIQKCCTYAYKKIHLLRLHH